MCLFVMSGIRFNYQIIFCFAMNNEWACVILYWFYLCDCMNPYWHWIRLHTFNDIAFGASTLTHSHSHEKSMKMYWTNIPSIHQIQIHSYYILHINSPLSLDKNKITLAQVITIGASTHTATNSTTPNIGVERLQHSVHKVHIHIRARVSVWV